MRRSMEMWGRGGGGADGSGMTVEKMDGLEVSTWDGTYELTIH